jgi:membrane-bound serine protease (ClpP class)
MGRLVQGALWIALAALLIVVPAWAQDSSAQDSTATVPSIELSGTIDPASANWIDSALSDAADDDVPLAIIRLDTPGGLESSMRDIVQDIIEAPMPVVVYVAPDGARAASAGAFIAESADVVAMAPQTNIGSASAIQSNGQDIGGTLEIKIENDAAAFIRALAEAHGRDGEAPGQMVTEAANFTAGEALEANAIDLIAADEADLLGQLDGFAVAGPKQTTLQTDDVVIEDREPSFANELLSIIVNPTVAYLLLLIGIVGIAIELFSPGLIVPGAFGTISLLLGAFGSSQLPVTVTGIALLVIGLALIIAEAQLPTHGVLGFAGVVAIVFAGLLLFDTDSDAFEVSVPVVIVAGVLFGGFVAFAATKTVQAHRPGSATGREHMVGETGSIRVAIDPIGQVFVDGALWRATLAADAADADAERVRELGARVRVEAVEGLTLRVRPLEAVVSSHPAEQGERT